MLFLRECEELSITVRADKAVFYDVFLALGAQEITREYMYSKPFTYSCKMYSPQMTTCLTII